jgi:hypothetical protein
VNKKMSASTRSAAIRVIVGVPLLLVIAYGVLLGVVCLFVILTREHRPIPLEEITQRTGLQFPDGTVLVGSHFDAMLMGVSYAARLHVPREGFAKLLSSLPEHSDVARGNETNGNIWSFPETYFEETWWTPERMQFSLRAQLQLPNQGVLLGADESNEKYVDVLLFAQVD